METSEEVLLANLTEEHIDHFISLSYDPDLISGMGWKGFHPGEGDRFLQTLNVLTVPYLQTGKSMIFSILDAKNRRAIGCIVVKGIDTVRACAEIGIAIMDKAYRGKGYGTEALRMSVEYSHRELGLTRLGLTVFPDNQRAIRAYEKVGFVKKELLKEYWLLPSGEYADMWLMETYYV